MTLLRLWPVGVAVLAIVAGQWAYIGHLRDALSSVRADLDDARASITALKEIQGYEDDARHAPDSDLIDLLSGN